MYMLYIDKTNGIKIMETVTNNLGNYDIGGDILSVTNRQTYSLHINKIFF